MIYVNLACFGKHLTLRRGGFHIGSLCMISPLGKSLANCGRVFTMNYPHPLPNIGSFEIVMDSQDIAKIVQRDPVFFPSPPDILHVCNIIRDWEDDLGTVHNLCRAHQCMCVCMYSSMAIQFFLHLAPLSHHHNRDTAVLSSHSSVAPSTVTCIQRPLI